MNTHDDTCFPHAKGMSNVWALQTSKRGINRDNGKREREKAIRIRKERNRKLGWKKKAERNEDNEIKIERRTGRNK
jgi:hypothetical protein